MARVRTVLVGSAVVAGVVALGAVVAVRVLVSGPLAGPSRHDFGVVRIDTPPAEVSHTFRLVNRGDETLVLRNVKRSCNCAAVDASPEVIEPGATLEVDVTMTLSSASEKQSRITLVLEQGEREVIRDLFVTARGERVAGGPAG